MDQMLVDAVIEAMMVLETAPLYEEFDSETLSFFQDLYLWRRPEKFLLNGGPFKFVAGRVALWNRTQRVLQFEFDNGYVWDASISKLGTKTLISHCRLYVQQEMNKEWNNILDEEAA